MNDGNNGVFKKSKGFTVVYNTAARDKRLSEKALGLYTRIASYITMPDEQVTKGKIMSWCSCGTKAFESAWQELKECGYLIQRMQAASGREWRVEYELLSTPRTDGVHTFYVNAAGVTTTTNLTRKKSSLSKNTTDSKVKATSKTSKNDVTPKTGITSEISKNDVTPKTGITSKTSEKRDSRRYPQNGYNVNGDNVKGGNKINTININTNPINTKEIINNNINPPPLMKDIKYINDDSLHPDNEPNEPDKEESFWRQWRKVHKSDERIDPIIQVISQELSKKEKINLGSYASPYWTTCKAVITALLALTDRQMEDYLRQFAEYDKPVNHPGRFHLIGMYNQTRADTRLCYATESQGKASALFGSVCINREYKKADWDNLEKTLNKR